MDATYRADLRELNELNFSRFDSKLEQRVIQLDAKMERLVAEIRGEMRAMEARIEASIQEIRADC